jgi:hypothetical protein
VAGENAFKNCTGYGRTICISEIGGVLWEGVDRGPPTARVHRISPSTVETSRGKRTYYRNNAGIPFTMEDLPGLRRGVKVMNPRMTPAEWFDSFFPSAPPPLKPCFGCNCTIPRRRVWQKDAGGVGTPEGASGRATPKLPALMKINLRRGH